MVEIPTYMFFVPELHPAGTNVAIDIGLPLKQR
jgi:hypothetical protein